jgi:uncharacterized protein (DUF3820 family)
MSSITFKFGKYKGHLVEHVISEYPGYCKWLIHQKDFKLNNPEMYNLFIVNGIEFHEDYDKQNEENKRYKREYITFGKYKGQRIKDIYEKNPDYCKYIISLPNVQTYHKPLIKTINDLIESDETMHSEK